MFGQKYLCSDFLMTDVIFLCSKITVVVSASWWFYGGPFYEYLLVRMECRPSCYYLRSISTVIIFGQKKYYYTSRERMSRLRDGSRTCGPQPVLTSMAPAHTTTRALSSTRVPRQKVRASAVRWPLTPMDNQVMPPTHIDAAKFQALANCNAMFRSLRV